MTTTIWCKLRRERREAMPAVVKELYFHDQYREPLLMKTSEYYEYGVYVSVQSREYDLELLSARKPVQLPGRKVPSFRRNHLNGTPLHKHVDRWCPELDGSWCWALKLMGRSKSSERLTMMGQRLTCTHQNGKIDEITTNCKSILHFIINVQICPPSAIFDDFRQTHQFFSVQIAWNDRNALSQKMK